jgi:dCTP deaminase
MTVLSAQSIRAMCTQFSMIRPFRDRSVTAGLTGGVGPASYDVHIRHAMWLWPFWGRLGVLEEEFDIPTDVIGEVKDKSSNARRFVLVQNTLIDPGFHGGITIELTRFRPWPVRIAARTPIAQIKFSWLDEATDRPYRGKYQGQSARKPTPMMMEVAK